MPAMEDENRRPRSRDELLELFSEQMAFLGNSASSFDEGCSAEAKRLATTIRVLIHDTSKSISLLKQLGIKNSIEWVTTIEAPNPRNILASNDYILTKMHAYGMEYLPLLGTGPFGLTLPKMTFASWWNAPVHKEITPPDALQNVEEHESEVDGQVPGQLWSRRDFVLWLANKEGGAHVDPYINTEYEFVARGGSTPVSIRIEEKDEFGLVKDVVERKIEINRVQVAVRQVAFEFQATFEYRKANGLIP